MSQFPGFGEFEVIVLFMEVTMAMVNDSHNAHNMISLTSKVT